MMLWYKAWRESRTRFALCAGSLAVLCTGVSGFYSQLARSDGLSHVPYTEYVWRLVYKGSLREIFLVFALVLGLGGLLRERTVGTVGFTLSLPVSRMQLELSRACAGVMEVAALALIPVLVIPGISASVGQAYPAAQAREFAELWIAGGTLAYGFGFLASVLFAGDYTAGLAAFGTFVVSSVAAEFPGVSRLWPNVGDVMSGAEMAYFRQDTYLLVGPTPWGRIGELLFTGGVLVAVGVAIASRREA